ncbi:MAG: transporter substrate-binding domain-containing protein [Longimicrobiales bacterium]|nr:transporter substrate-binding domain-containing protein [Longimicrobiales bacterium]
MNDRFGLFRWIWLGTFVISVPSVTSCRARSDDTLGRVEAGGFVRAGYAQEPPYAFLLASGRVDGEAPAALRHALAAVGVDSIRWILHDFEDLLPALEQGRVDVVAAGLFITEERRERVLFSRPTMCARPALAFRTEASPPPGLASFLGDGSGVLAVVSGSVEHQAVKVLGIPASTTLQVPDVKTGLVAVRSGHAEALAMTAPTLQRAVAAADGLAWRYYEAPPAVAPLVGGCSALVFRRSDIRLAEAVNVGLEGYVGARSQRAVFDRLALWDTAVPAAGPADAEGPAGAAGLAEPEAPIPP